MAQTMTSANTRCQLPYTRRISSARYVSSTMTGYPRASPASDARAQPPCASINLRQIWGVQQGGIPSDAMKGAGKWNSNWEAVTIPHTWNATDMQKKRRRFMPARHTTAKRFTPDPDLKGKRVFLRFEGVGSCAEVYINGYLAGTHRAYSLLCADRTSAQVWRGNELIVKADNSERPDVIPVQSHPVWRIWRHLPPRMARGHRPVCHSCQRLRIAGCVHHPENVTSKSADVAVKVKVGNSLKSPASMRLEKCGLRYGRPVGQNRQAGFHPHSPEQPVDHLFIPHLPPHLWQGREDPYLYKVVSTLYRDGKKVDEVVQPSAFAAMRLSPATDSISMARSIPCMV